MVEVPDEILDELYQLPPERFIAARDDAVEAARRAGDRATATAIGKLRRPTVGAWLVNLLAHRAPELLGDLLTLGDQLRRAQHDLRGDEMRELSGKRRAAIGGLVGQARRLAVQAGRSARDNLPLAEVEATLTAALAEPDVAEAVRSGTLTKTVGYAGFGETPRPRLRVIEGGRPAEPPPAKDRAPEKPDRRAEAEARAAEAARTRAKQAQEELRSATAAEQEAARAFAALTAQLEDVRERHAQAQLVLRQARLRLKAAQRAAARTGA